MTSLREQQELKRSAVTTVSHQLRNPLTSIRMSVHLLLEENLGPLNPQQTELLLAARDESERLTAVVEELLDLNRMESGRTLLDIEAISPVTWSETPWSRSGPDARDKGITLDYTVPDDLPNVLGDSKRLQHVLSNLVSNALRFTKPGGSVTVSAEAGDEVVKFKVSDTGTGIAPEHQPRLFEPFFRVPGQEKPSGVGLGLAIVREIIAAQGGNVGVTSEPGTVRCSGSPCRYPPHRKRRRRLGECLMEHRADSFLRLVRRSQRGKLKIYLGYCAGVGKTYQMLLEAQRFKDDGIDVVAGLVETHGRAETECLLSRVGGDPAPATGLSWHRDPGDGSGRDPRPQTRSGAGG